MSTTAPQSDAPRPKTLEEYVELVDRAIFALEERRMGAEYDMASLGNAMGALNDLEQQLRELRLSLSNGRHRFADSDLPFIALAERQSDDVLPAKDLLRLINRTHRQGLDIEGP